MKFKKLLMLFICILMLACASNLITNSTSYKRVNYPGLPTEKPYISYTVDFEMKSNFTLKDVKLNTESVKFNVLSKNDNAITKDVSLLKSGAYSISFNSNQIKNIDVKEIVTLIFSINNKTYKEQLIIEKREALRRK